MSARFSALDDHLEAVGVVVGEEGGSLLGGLVFWRKEREVEMEAGVEVGRVVGCYRVVADEVLWLGRELR